MVFLSRTVSMFTIQYAHSSNHYHVLLTIGGCAKDSMILRKDCWEGASTGLTRERARRAWLLLREG